MTYNHQDAALVNSDYGRHIHRTWVDTHRQSIRTDSEIYLPGEVTVEEEDGGEADEDDEDKEDTEDDGGVADMTSGMKRKASSRTSSGLPRKVAKTTARGGPSTAALGIIDDSRPDLTLIDAPVGESTLTRPYGRHGCLYIEVKVSVDEKPNPQGTVSRIFLVALYY